MSVGQELQTQKTELEKLIRLTPAGPNRNDLRDKLDDVLDKIALFVEDNVDAASTKYTIALAELQAANMAIKVAQNDLEKTAETITKIAKACRIGSESD